MAAILLKLWDGYKLLFEELPETLADRSMSDQIRLQYTVAKHSRFKPLPQIKQTLDMQNFYQKYNHLMDILPDPDPRVNGWWLMKSPAAIATLLATYLFFCTYAGPQYMKDRKPYQLKNVIRIYNLFQITVSGYLVYLTIRFINVRNYKFCCVNIDYSNTPEGIKEAYTVWVYFMVKVSELLETVFFVLRKKNNQVSFLHLYHHTVMTSLSWTSTKYSAGGQCILDGGLNSLVHVFMYGYYLVANLGPQYQIYLWWKKYLTSIQLVQFTFIAYMNMDCLLYNNGNYPIIISLFVISNCCIFFYMFGKFFYTNYVIKHRNKSLKDC